jgi:hypothetical protein
VADFPAIFVKLSKLPSSFILIPTSSEIFLNVISSPFISTSEVGSFVPIPTQTQLDIYICAAPEPVINPLVLSLGSNLIPIDADEETIYP